MTTGQLKKRITKKFGSVSAFARESGIDRYELQKLFARKFVTQSELYDMASVCDRTDASEQNGTVDESKIESLREALMKAGGVYAFCKANPEFPAGNMYVLLRSKRMRMSGLLQRLFDFFEIE